MVRPKAKDPFQQGYQTSTRIYRNNYSQLELDIIEDGISRQASHKEILESLAPHGDWDDNRLKYALGKHFSRKNLKGNDAAYILRECKRAEREGRPIPKFRHLGRCGQRVKDRVIKRILKEEHKLYNIGLDEGDDLRRVRVEEPGEDYLEVECSKEVTIGPFEEVNGYFELVPSTIPYFNTFAATGANVVLFEPQVTADLQSRYLQAVDYSWASLEPNNQTYFIENGSTVQVQSERALQTDWISDFSDNFDLESWLRESSAFELEDLDTLIKSLTSDLKKHQGWIESRAERSRVSLGAGQFRASVESPGNLGHTDPPEAWSEHGLPKLNQWINTGQVVALEVLARIITEHRKSGIQNLYTCYENLAEKWNPKTSLFLYFMDWDCTKVAPPPHILLSLFESPESIPLEIRDAFRNKLVEIDVPSPEVRELESQELRRIFKANFSDVIRISQAHQKNERWSRGLTSITVHLITIEERFGPDHYLLIRAIFRFATVMERAELHGINDKDIIPLLFILLNKLSRLKLEDSPTGDIPHALIHLYRSLVRIRNFSGARKVLMRYRKDKKKIGPWDEELHQSKILMVTGMELLHSKDERQRAKGLRYLRQVMRFFDRRNSSVPILLKTHGTSVACFDFLHIGKYLKYAGSAGEAITSFLISIEHSSRLPEYELSARKYEGVFELGLCYEIMGLPLKALECFNDDYEYRRRVGLLDTAGLTREALRRNLQKCGLSQQVRPSKLSHIQIVQQTGPAEYFDAGQEICALNSKNNTDLEDENGLVTGAGDFLTPYSRLNEEYGRCFNVVSSEPDIISTTIGILEYIDPRTEL
ncbi:hypothetical protein TWF506_006225 [Arthrobotrys conoides]|uniref:Clr5 domain-containing protein n=1 Tax=Arthrobotrys conoides TaxID=74498 RepID=A0AAN8S0E8_9PEZI